MNPILSTAVLVPTKSWCLGVHKSHPSVCSGTTAGAGHANGPVPLDAFRDTSGRGRREFSDAADCKSERSSSPYPSTHRNTADSGRCLDASAQIDRRAYAPDMTLGVLC